MGEMKLGAMDRRLTISVPNTAVDPEYGGIDPAWTNLATIWGEARPLRGREFLAAAQVVAGAEIEFVIHWRDDFDERARIVHDGTPYEILHIAELGRRAGLRILGKKP